MIAKALLLASLLVAGCAHGTDGLRQTCTATDVAISGGYQLMTAAIHPDLQALRFAALAGKDGAKEALLAREVFYGKALSSLDAARSSKDAVCRLAPSIDAGMKADIPSLIQQVLAIAADVQKAIASIKEVK